MTEKPKPCPFCGGEKIDTESGIDTGWAWCLSCNATGPEISSREIVSRGKIIEAWNSRRYGLRID